MAEAEPTRSRLAKALAEIPGMPRDLIARAVDGRYDDYLSESAFPQTELIDDLLNLRNLPSTGPTAREAILRMIRRVEKGDFDATAEEADAWARSAEGQQAWRDLTGGQAS